MRRRAFVSISAGMGMGVCEGSPDRAEVRAAVERTVGARGGAAGMVAVVVDERGMSRVVCGSSGVSGVGLGAGTVFEIGSITKVFTALLLAEMEGRGEVAFDEPVGRYLPASVSLRERGRAITLLDLATYTCGLPKLPGNLPANWWAERNPFAGYSVEALYSFLGGHVPAFAPGGHFEYSSLGFGLLGVALARRAGMRFEELLLRRVCGPLGLSHTRIGLSEGMRRRMVRPHGLDLQPTPPWDFLEALQGAGALRASVEDGTRFLKACMGVGRCRLAGPMARLLGTRRATNLAGTEAGLGWFVTSSGGEEIAWKSGLTGGCNAFIGFSTKRRRGALVLSNFVWEPLDVGTTRMGMRLIEPGFEPGDLGVLYR